MIAAVAFCEYDDTCIISHLAVKDKFDDKVLRPPGDNEGYRNRGFGTLLFRSVQLHLLLRRGFLNVCALSKAADDSWGMFLHNHGCTKT